MHKTLIIKRKNRF